MDEMKEGRKGRKDTTIRRVPAMERGAVKYVLGGRKKGRKMNEDEGRKEDERRKEGQKEDAGR